MCWGREGGGVRCNGWLYTSYVCAHVCAGGGRGGDVMAGYRQDTYVCVQVCAGGGRGVCEMQWLAIYKLRM